MVLVYSLDVEVRDEAEVLRRFLEGLRVSDRRRMSSIASWLAPVGTPSRPLVIGAGPCGLFAVLLLAQMGFRPILIERGGARDRR